MLGLQPARGNSVAALSFTRKAEQGERSLRLSCNTSVRFPAIVLASQWASLPHKIKRPPNMFHFFLSWL